ncbi:C40 family peptidase [Pedobacter sp. Du54]|uniref:C40 family peptidase n=1 Tax=Pedobacter anseongensis TaxID=3133439 RepID=UPI0030B476B1
MNKTLLILCLFACLALTSNAQEKENTSLPKQYQQIMGGKLLDFAKSFIGTRYRYASSNPKIGFDCSGFVSYVYKQFGFSGARSSADFAKKGKTITLSEAKLGDILIFTGTNSKLRTAGHVGIIYAKDEDGNIKFIHSSSGKAKGVTITNLDGVYKHRFLKAVTVVE